MQTIVTPQGKYRFKRKTLYQGIKQIDKQKSFENLCLFNDIAKKYSFDFILAYGTLLGAIRDKDFIDHDEDIDLGALYDEKDKLLSMLFELRDNGFEVARWDSRGLMSIIRNNEYIDIYLFKHLSKKLYAVCGAPFPKIFIDEKTTVNFKGLEFNVPADYIENLKYLYGDSWHTPISDNDFEVPMWRVVLYKTKDFIKQLLPKVITNFYERKQEAEAYSRYFQRGVLDKYLD